MIIRVVAFLLFILYSTVGFNQEISLLNKISINIENASIYEALQEINNKSNINFSYSNQAINSKRTISLNVEDKTVEEILSIICKEYKVKYSLIENQIVIRKSYALNEMQHKETKYTISGFVKDSETGESLIGAAVIIEGTNIGSITNSYGFYSVTLPLNNYEIKYSYLGYVSKSEIILLNKNIYLSHNLVYNNELLTEVEINRNEQSEIISINKIGKIRLKPRDFKNMPELLGETGLIKNLQTLPGIKSLGDGSAFFFVRGGNKDHNLILIDEAPIYNVSHLFGLYSVVIPDVTKDIKIYKGDLPVSQGDRLSSVIDIRTKDGNLNKFEYHGVLNPLIYRFSVEGPIVKQKSSFFTSFRHSNFKWLYKSASPDLNLYFYDFTSKFNIKINNNNRIFFTIYSGKDDFSSNEIDASNFGINWQNFASTLRWNHIYNEKLFSNTMVYLSSYDYNLNFLDMENYSWNSAITNFTIKSDYTYYSSPRLKINFGGAFNAHNFNPGNINLDSLLRIPKISKYKSNEKAFYFNAENKLTKRFSYNVGIRVPIWKNIGPTTIYTFDAGYNIADTLVFDSTQTASKFFDIDPRISFKYNLSSTSAIKASYGVYHQYIQLLSNTTTPFSSLEVWLPSGQNIKPQQARLFSLGYVKYLEKHKLKINAEIYYKRMENQIEYEPHANMLLNPYLEGELRFGNAWSYGAEFIVKKIIGRVTGWVSYTYSRAIKQTKDINNNEPYNAFYDIPHDFSSFLAYQYTKRLNISANFTYNTGLAITTPTGFYNYNGNIVPFYAQKNNDRLPDYHRLDLSITYKLNKLNEKKFKHYLTFAVYNIYNRHNPISLNFNKVKTKNGNFVVPADIYGTSSIIPTQINLLGTIPSLTYKFNF